jgi:D-alanyl-D-alanine dipeptidase
MPRYSNKLQRAFKAALFCLILLVSASAQTAPPREENKREADLVELTKLDKTIKLDIRYATANNFVGRPVYPEARAFLQRPAAEAVVRVHKQLKKKGLGIVIFDGYRPWTITKLFWDVVPEDKRKFVADPVKGSKHNRGCAIDLSIYVLKTGELIPMPSGYDEFTERASPDYKGGTDQERANREMLRKLMEAEGFTVNPNEWWHFDYKDWQSYAIYDISFDAIRNFQDIEGHTVGSVFLEGNTFRDREIRSHVFLREGHEFSSKDIQKTIESINKIGKFEEINTESFSWTTTSDAGTVDFIIYLIPRGAN